MDPSHPTPGKSLRLVKSRGSRHRGPVDPFPPSVTEHKQKGYTRGRYHEYRLLGAAWSRGIDDDMGLLGDGCLLARPFDAGYPARLDLVPF